MTENHPTGQNPTPAQTAGLLLLATCAVSILTPGQLAHLDTLIGLTGLILTTTPRTGRQ
ncbi:hypothetical protein pZL12.83 [Streptomyces phage ZL12]|uniref:Uncharacterized protein n=1 Tax=Streptomyces phage ZL12 TaxID=2570911 RepID=D0UWI8_9CAUD|nr:hypothetical protein QEH43_gp083 [Streptomyces phage ZL12]ACX71160.1 hypothetical protein pZL12.83 [Streptomyces phage ZL12]